MTVTTYISKCQHFQSKEQMILLRQSYALANSLYVLAPQWLRSYKTGQSLREDSSEFLVDGKTCTAL